MNLRVDSSVSESFYLSESQLEEKTLMHKIVQERHKIPKDRVDYLWSRARNFASVIGKFNVMNQDIKLYGANKNHFSTRIARTYTSMPTDLLGAKKWVIYPKSLFKQIWNVVIFVLLIWTAVFLPFRICFLLQVELQLLVTEIVIDFIFLLDILVNFFSAYQDQKKQLVTKNTKIALHYVKTWFFIDILACVPFQLIETDDRSEGQDYNKLIRILRLPKLYKLFRVLRLFKLIRIFRSENVFNKSLKKIQSYKGFLRLINFLSTVILIVHVVACTWYYIARIEQQSEDNWVFRYGVNELPVEEKYLISLYWVFTTLTTVGFGDIVPRTSIQKVFALLIMVLGVGFYSYVISNISSIISNHQSINQHIKSRLDMLNTLAVSAKLPDQLVNRLRLNIENHNSAFYSNQSQQQALIKSLPMQVRNKLSKYLHQEFVKNIHFFKQRHSSFLMYIVPKLKTVRCQGKELIYIIGDPAFQMYFINSGRIAFRARNSIIFRSYGKGCYFGESEIILNQPRHHTVQVTSMIAQLFTLSSLDFSRMVKEFPEIGEQVTAISQVRVLKHSEAQMHVIRLQPRPSGYLGLQFLKEEDFWFQSEIYQQDEKNYSDKKRVNRFDTNEEIKSQWNEDQARKRNQMLWENSNLDLPLLVLQNSWVTSEYSKSVSSINCHLNYYEKEVFGLDPKETLQTFQTLRKIRTIQPMIEESMISLFEKQESVELQESNVEVWKEQEENKVVVGNKEEVEPVLLKILNNQQQVLQNVEYLISELLENV